MNIQYTAKYATGLYADQQTLKWKMMFGQIEFTLLS